MRVAIWAVTGAIAVVALVIALWSDNPRVRKASWAIATVAVLGGVLAWVLLDLTGVPGRIK